MYFYIDNCYSIIHKDPSITTYYAISPNNAYVYFTDCYTDNTEITPIIYDGVTLQNLQDIQYSTNILPNINHDTFSTIPNNAVKYKYLDLNSIYIKFNEGYYIYSFIDKKWIRKYTTLTNANSIKIIQNGMSQSDFNKITQKIWVDLSKEHSSVEIINCINAHNKIIYRTQKISLQTYKKEGDKRIVRKKIKFSDFDNEITNISRN